MASNLENFIKGMNEYGKNGVPFLFVIDYEMNDPLIFRLEEAAKNDIFFSIHHLRNYTDTISESQQLHFIKKPIEYARYETSFKRVLKQIQLGNTFLLNLTFPTKVETNWSLRTIFERSNAPYKLLVKDDFVLFSPECFVKINKGNISSFPMKGTIDASLLNAEELIINDLKEKAEHATIVDLIRNDLSIVASDVKVNRYRFIEEIVTHDKRLLQVSSEISGTLPIDYQSNIGSIICKLLPAGSICGAPKDSTRKIIEDVEGYKRGYYSGVFGIFDGQNVDSAVMIRYIEQKDGQMFYKSGGGITMNSDLEKEYNELIDKVYVTAY